MKYAGLLLALVLAGSAQAADPAFQNVMSCMRSSVPPMLQADDFRIESTDKTGNTRVLEGKFYAQRNKNLMRIMLRISSPSTVAGASYLVIEKKNASEDDMYVFLPSVGRVRHVTGAFANSSLLGTDFSYAEIKQISNAFSGASGKLEGTDKIDDRDVSVITLKPQASKASAYSTVKAWVDQESCLVLKAEFNAGSNVRKRMTIPAGSIKPSGKYWYLTHIEMQDLKLGTHTVMQLSDVTSEKAIPVGYFNPATFHLGH